jgi:protein PhnA
MSLDRILASRSENACELCKKSSKITAYILPPKSTDEPTNCVVLCQSCLDAVSSDTFGDGSAWRFLSESVWHPEPAVQVLSHYILNRINDQPWAQDTLGMAYLDDENAVWLEELTSHMQAASIVHKDSNGHQLFAGDTVTLIKDLDVKGATFTAKRGAAVRNIRLVPDNTGQIEGKVNDQSIVILTQYVKKS